MVFSSEGIKRHPLPLLNQESGPFSVLFSKFRRYLCDDLLMTDGLPSAFLLHLKVLFVRDFKLLPERGEFCFAGIDLAVEVRDLLLIICAYGGQLIKFRLQLLSQVKHTHVNVLILVYFGFQFFLCDGELRLDLI